MNPHFSMYCLGGHARSVGLVYEPFDMNLEYYNTVLTPRYMDVCHSLCENALEYLYARVSLGKYRGEHSKEFGALAARYFELEKYLRKQPKVWDHVKNNLPEAVETLRNKSLFYQPVSLLSAYLTIDKALELVSLPYYPSRLRFNDFSAPLQPMTVAGLLEFTRDEGENPFLAFARSRVSTLLRGLRDTSEPAIIGISINSHSQLFGGLTFARLLKERRPEHVHINIGGNYFARVKHVILDNPKFLQTFADSVTIGEGERSITGFAEVLPKGGSLAEVPNIVYLDEEEFPRYSYTGEPLPLSERAYGDLTGISLDKYFTPEIVLSTRTSKGCYWQKCTFCDTDFGITPDVCAPKHVLNEWRLFKEKWGIENFELIDESMTPAYMQTLCKSIVDGGLQVQFFGNGRTDKEFTQPVFAALKQAGLTMVLWGMESGCKRILNLIKKGVDAEGRLDILRAAKAEGVWNFAYIFFGFPSETEEEANETIRLIKDNRDIINAYGRSVFTLGKQSKIRGNAEELGIVDMISDDQEFSTILFYKVSKGMDRQAALRVADRCRQECAEAYETPLWMFLRHREVIHLYLKELGNDFVASYKLPDEELSRIRYLYDPTPERLINLGLLPGDDSP